MPTSAREWKGKKKSEAYELELPSGNTCLIKAPGMEAFIAGGFIPNSLMDLVMKGLDKNSGKPQKSKAAQEKEMTKLLDEMRNDPEKLQDLFDTVDRVTVHCVVQPHVEATPEDGTERDPDILYVDEVDFEDKMYVFNAAVGGSKDLERFREGVSSGVDAIQARAASPRPTKRTSRRK